MDISISNFLILSTLALELTVTLGKSSGRWREEPISQGAHIINTLWKCFLNSGSTVQDSSCAPVHQPIAGAGSAHLPEQILREGPLGRWEAVQGSFLPFVFLMATCKVRLAEAQESPWKEV